MQRQVAISVVVPAYNEERLIDRCLISLKKQQFPYHFEIIVVDNNSTDKTEGIARSFGIKVITETHQGVVAARNRGLYAARGDVVVGADADCTYPSRWLALLFTHFQKDPHVVAVGGPVRPEKNPFWGYLMYEIGFRLVQVLYKITGKVLYLGAFNFAFRRKVFMKLGGYRTYLDFGGDEWDPLGRLQKVGKVIFDPRLKIDISLRRYRVGLLRFIFIHMIFYYTLNYLTAKLFKRTLIHAQPVRNT